MERRAGFNPNQPRVPAGNPDGGQWTSEGSAVTAPRAATSGPQTITDESDFPVRLGQQYAAARGPRDRLPPIHHIPSGSEGGSSPYRAGQVTIENNAQTGYTTIDENTEKLRTILQKVVNSRGEGYGPQYGTAIHHDFGDAVKEAIRSGKLRGDIRVEHTYPERETRYGREQDTWYGKEGTIRTDIVLRNELGEVVAIYDVKTGGAYLGTRRVAELRAKTGAGLRVPMIEMHTQRGLSLKSHAASARYFWFITLRLWNPWYELVEGQGTDAIGS
jgi:hypothetical protein